MSDSSAVFDAFESVITQSLLPRNDIIIIRGDIDTEDDFPVVAISPGQIKKADLTKNLIQCDFSIYTDIYLRASVKSFYTEISAISDLMVTAVRNSSNLGLSMVFKIDDPEINEPDRSETGLEYSTRTRLEWLIEYHTAR